MKVVLKNKVFYVLALFFVALCLCFTGAALSVNEVRAATPAVTFEKGASIRIDTSEKNTSGMRFTANIDQSVYDAVVANGEIKANAEIGMIIVPASYIERAQAAGRSDYFAYFTEKTGLTKAQLSSHVTANQIVNNQIRCALVKIDESDFARNFRAILYYTTDGGASYHYSLGEDERNVMLVAQRAVADISKTYDEEATAILNNYATYDGSKVIFDMSKTESASKFVTPDKATSTWSATANVEYQGKVATKINVTASNGNGLYAKVDYSGVDFTGYDSVKFSVYSPNSGNFVVCTAGWGTVYKPDGTNHQQVTANTWSEISIPVRVLDENGDGVIDGNPKSYFYVQAIGSISSTSTSKDVYFGDFKAISAEKKAEILVSALPKADEVTDADKAAIQRAQAAVEALDDNSSIDTDNLNACVLQVNAKPYVVYDMSDSATLNKFNQTDNTGENAWTGSLATGETFDGKSVMKMSVDSQTANTASVDFNLDGIDLSGYDYVSFWVYTTYDYSGTSFRVRNAWDNKLASNPTLPKNTWVQVSISATNFVSAVYFDIVTGINPGKYDLYITDVIAFSASNVKAMIELLPEAAYITEEDRADVIKAREYYNLLTADEQATVDNEKLTACEEALANLPYVVYDMSKTETAGKFTINNTAVSGYEWNGEITSGQMFNGKYALKLAVQENVDNQNQIYFQYALNVDLSDYTHVTFSVYSPYSGDVKLATGQEANRVFIGTAVANAWTTITVDASTFASKGYFDIITAQKSGYAVYLSDFIAYNAKSVQIMIDKLPEASEVTWEHEAQVVEVREYVNSLTSAEQATLDLSKLTAAEETLAELPYTFYDMSKAETAGKFTINNTAVSGYEWNGEITSGQMFNGKYALKLAVQENVDNQNQIYFQYALNVDLGDYTHVTFSVYSPYSGDVKLATGQEANRVVIGTAVANAWTTITVDASTFASKGYFDIITAQKSGYAVYLSDFVAYKEHPVQYEINALPDTVAAGDVAQVEAARASYDALSDDDKLIIAEARLLDAEEQVAGLPLVVYDMSNTATASKFNQRTGYTGQGAWTGSLTTGETFDGKSVMKMSVDSQTANTASVDFNLDGIDLSGYDYVSFWVYTTYDSSGTSFRVRNAWDNKIASNPTLPKNTWVQVSISATNFVSAVYFDIVTSNNPGKYDLYITDVIATSEATVAPTEYSSYAWSAPGTTTAFTGDLTTAYANYAAAGFDTVYMYGENGYGYNGATAWGSKAEATVTAAKAAGINRFIVHHYVIDQLIARIKYPDEGLIGTQQSGYQYESEAKLDAVVKGLLDLVVNNSIGANVVGFSLTDEPTIEYALTTGQVYKSIKRVYPNMEIILNLLPGAAGTTETSVGYENAANRYVGAKYETITSVRDRYEYYINTFFENTGADNLSVDMYPFVQTSSWFTTTEKFEANYYMTLQVLAEQCKIHNAELSFVLQSYQNADESYAKLDQKQMRLQMNSILAFGAADYSFFTYVDQTNSGAAFVDTNGNATSVYNYAKNVAAEADSLYTLLKDYRYQAARVISSSSTYTGNVENGTFKKVTSVSGGSALLATESINAKGDCLYAISNVYSSGTASVTVNFDVSVKSITVYTLSADGGSYTAATVDVSSGAYSLSLAQGSAAYIVVNK